MFRILLLTLILSTMSFPQYDIQKPSSSRNTNKPTENFADEKCGCCVNKLAIQNVQIAAEKIQNYKRIVKVSILMQLGAVILSFSTKEDSGLQTAATMAGIIGGTSLIASTLLLGDTDKLLKPIDCIDESQTEDE